MIGFISTGRNSGRISEEQEKEIDRLRRRKYELKKFDRL